MNSLEINEILIRLRKITKDLEKISKNPIGKQWQEEPKLLLKWMKKNKIKSSIMDITRLWSKHKNVSIKARGKMHNEYGKVSHRIECYDKLGLVKSEVINTPKGFGKTKIWWAK